MWCADRVKHARAHTQVDVGFIEILLYKYTDNQSQKLMQIALFSVPIMNNVRVV